MTAAGEWLPESWRRRDVDEHLADDEPAPAAASLAAGAIARGLADAGSVNGRTALDRLLGRGRDDGPWDD